MIKEAFTLKSANDKLMQPKRFYATDNEEQIKELEKFIEADSVEEVVSQPKKNEPKKSTSEGKPDDDITLVKGVGAGLQKKLAALEQPVTTKTALAAALEREDVKEALGQNLNKVTEYFAKSE